MTAIEKVDTVNNRERVDVDMNIPGVGFGTVLQLLDLNAKIYT
jgi:hypothetical protein